MRAVSSSGKRERTLCDQGYVVRAGLPRMPEEATYTHVTNKKGRAMSHSRRDFLTVPPVLPSCRRVPYSPKS